MVEEQWDIFALLKWWDFADNFRNGEVLNIYIYIYIDIYLIDVRIYYFGSTHTQGPAYIFPWDLWSLLRCKKGKWSFWKNTKNTRHKTGTHFKIQL